MSISERLPEAEWTRRAGLARVAEALGEGNLRWVGGAVRDTLLGLPVSDVDAATALQPDDVIRELDRAGIRTVPTGIAHGTVTALLKGGNVEITTLRRDVSTDGRRATVQFTDDWREDAARRDFTINALYADPRTLEIFDYFGGRSDLAARRVRFIGEARERIREDHLRILRYFRFQARFGALPDEEAEAACIELRDMLKGLSRERVAMELLNLLALPDPAPTVARMHLLGIWQVVLPETARRELSVLGQLAASEVRHGVAPDPLRRLASLLPPLPSVAEAVAARLRLSGKQRKYLVCVAERVPEDAKAPRSLAYREGWDCAFDRLLLGGAGVEGLRGWEIPRLPIKGGDIVACGVTAGPQVARTLRAVEDQWIVEGFPDADRVREILAEILAR